MGFSTRRTPSGANSERKMADMRPTGMATRSAIAEVRNVALASTRIPKCFSAKSGVHWVSVRKSQSGTSRKNSTVSKMRTATMPAVVSTERKPERKRARRISSSRTFCAVRRRATRRAGRRTPRGMVAVTSSGILGAGGETCVTGVSTGLPEVVLSLLAPQEVDDGDAHLRALPTEEGAQRALVEARLGEGIRL